MTTLFAWLAVASYAAAAVAMSVVDAREHRIPDRVLFPELGIFAVFAALTSLVSHSWYPLLYAFVGGAVMFVLFYAIAFVSLQMGYGDVKYSALIGGVLGLAASRAEHPGASLVLAIPVQMWFASILGLLWAVGAKVAGVEEWKRVPYAPVLTLSTLALVVVGAASHSGQVYLPFDSLTTI